MTKTAALHIARRFGTGIAAAGVAAALVLGVGAGVASAATPAEVSTVTPSTGSTVGFDLFNHSHETLVYTHVTGRVAAPDEPILYNGDKQNFQLPWVTQAGHSSGDAYYNVFDGGTTPVAVLDVHFDVANPANGTWSITDPVSGQNVPGMSVQITSPESHGVSYTDKDYTVVDTPASAARNAA